MTPQRFLFALLFVLLSFSAKAQEYYVDVTNETGFTVMYLQVSPGKSKSWEEDVLGLDVILDGDTQRVNLYGYRSPIFDIRLTDEDGDTYTFWNVDVSTEDILVTLDDLD